MKFEQKISYPSFAKNLLGDSFTPLAFRPMGGGSPVEYYFLL
jgi:hypothetical protein